MSKYDCPYFSESRPVCDDGECGCLECQEVIAEAQGQLKKDVLDKVLHKVYEILGHMDNPPQGDWQMGCAYACGEIEDLVKYLKEHSND